MRARRAPEGGFTLTELLVTIALLVLVMVLLVFPMFAGFAYVEQGVARGDAQSAGRAAMDAMTRELAEAIYVYDLPADGSMIAFTLPSAVGRRVAPPGPQMGDPCGRYAAPVRYWRVLTRFQPQIPWQASEVVARVVVNGEPFRDDNENACWDAGETYEDLNEDGMWNAPQALALETRYPDGGYRGDYSLGNRDTAQLLASEPVAMDPRRSGEMTSLTPNQLRYEVPVLTFSPQSAEAETLRPVISQGGKDYSVYGARRGWWQPFRQGTDVNDPLTDAGRIVVYQRTDPDQPYGLHYHTKVNPAGGSVEIWDHPSSSPADHSADHLMYDTSRYPLRDDLTETYAFGLDRQSGRLLFSFVQPAYPDLELAALSVAGGESDAGATLRVGADGRARVIAGSEVVVAQKGSQRDVLQRVSDAGPLKQGQYRIDYERCRIAVNPVYATSGWELRAAYRWRNNGEDDLVVATYQSKSAITISLTTAKRFNMGRHKDRLEGYHTQTVVRLRNLARGTAD